LSRFAAHRRRRGNASDRRVITDTDGGFILVSVLWLLALVTLVTLVLLTAVRVDVRAAGQWVRYAEAEAMADGMTRLVALRLGDRDRRPLDAAGLARDGTPLMCRHGDTAVGIAVIDVGGLIDLNAASADLIAWLLRGLNVAPERAAALAAAIVDFRDEDDIPGVNGAESAAYHAAGLAHGPKNGPFETVTELDQVLGMDLTLLGRLRAVTTVHSRQPGIDPATAPREVVAAAATAAHAGVWATAFSGADATAATASSAEPARADIPSAFRIASRARAYRVTVTAQLPAGGRFAREAVIEPERTAPLGFHVREWTVPPSSPANFLELPDGAVSCVDALG
jgi:general secretion pathway protein K